MKVKHTTLFALFAILLAFMPFATVTADALAPPQVAIAGASEQLQKRMQDKNFIKDFNQVLIRS